MLDERWIDLNTRFHSRLNELSGRKRLCDMIETLRLATSAYLHIVVHHARDSGRGDHGHQEILDACRAGNVDQAVGAIRAHLNHTVEQTLRLIERLPENDGSGPSEPAAPSAATVDAGAPDRPARSGRPPAPAPP